jgi:hypothetical protein
VLPDGVTWPECGAEAWPDGACWPDGEAGPAGPGIIRRPDGVVGREVGLKVGRDVLPGSP